MSMLKGDFFHIPDLVSENGTIKAAIQLNPQHAVFSGHFPGMPVVPGVCQIQLVKEILCTGQPGSFVLAEAKVCKFIHMMDPSGVRDLRCELTREETPGGEVNFSGTLLDSNRIYLKIKGVLRKENG